MGALQSNDDSGGPPAVVVAEDEEAAAAVRPAVAPGVAAFPATDLRGVGALMIVQSGWEGLSLPQR